MTVTTYDVKQPLIAGSAFVFAAVLFQRANSQLIQTVPTLAIGDVKISLDGGGYANITTLPTEVGTTGELIVTLSGAETTGALKYISVKFVDAAGAEWCDVVYVIDVEEAKTVSDYAGGDTAGVTTILADYARRTGDYATVAAVAAIFAVVDTEVADIKAKTDQLVFTIANQVDANALTGGGVAPTIEQIRTEIDDNSTQLTAIKVKTDGLPSDPADQSLLIAAIAAITPFGSGSVAYTPNRATDPSGNPLDGVDTWAGTSATDSTIGVQARAYTNALGLVASPFMLDPGTYYVWRQHGSYSFTNPETVVIT